MYKEVTRLTTFSDWPVNSPITPTELAEDGFYYTGVVDRVKCAFCGLILKNWKSTDIVTHEHVLHGKRVCDKSKNIKKAYAHYYSDCGVRARTIDRKLAETGLYLDSSVGNIKCFSCGAKFTHVKGDPWFEHALWSPGCKYLRMVKGGDFIREIHEHKTPLP